MFTSFNLKDFAARLKTIRTSQGLTQSNVVEATGISSDTLRKIENGLCIPRYDTLVLLSHFYRTDILALLGTHKSSTDLIHFYESVDRHITEDNPEALKDTIDAFNKFKQMEDHQLVIIEELQQLDYFFEGMKISYKDQTTETYQMAIDHWCQALKITNPDFTINDWHLFKYSYVELRILYALASMLGLVRACEKSNEMLLYLLDTLDQSILSKHQEKILVTKTFALISYNYHRLDAHKNALEYAEKGIAYCNEYAIMANLPLLLSRKGMAMYHLNLADYKTFLAQGVTLLEIQGNHELANKYTQIIQRFLRDGG